MMAPASMTYRMQSHAGETDWPIGSLECPQHGLLTEGTSFTDITTHHKDWLGSGVR